MNTNVLSVASLSPGRDLEAYIQTINAFPILKPEEERALADRFYHEDDLDAARELVLSHLRSSSTRAQLFRIRLARRT